MKKSIFISLLLCLIFQYSFSVPDYSQSIIQKIEYSIDNKYLIASTRDSVSLFDTKDYKLIMKRNARASSFSPDNAYLAIADNNGNIILYSLKENIIKSQIHIPDYSYWIFSITFSSDGKYIACSDLKAKVYIISLQTKQIIKTIQTEYNANYLSFIGDNKFLLTSETFQNINIRDTKNYKLINTISVKPAYLGYSILSISNDGKYFLAVTSPNTSVIKKISTEEIVSTFSGLSRKPAIFSNDNKIVLSGLTNGTIKIYNSETGSEIKTLGDPVYTSSSSSGCTSGYASYRESLSHHVTSIAISSDKKTVISGYFFETIKIWDLEKSKLEKTIKIPYKFSNE